MFIEAPERVRRNGGRKAIGSMRASHGLGRRWSDEQALAGAADAHHGEHVRRLDASGGDFLFVASVDAVDEAAIPFALDREIGAEAPLDEGIDYVGEREERVEREPLDQQRQDVLCADSLEAV